MAGAAGAARGRRSRGGKVGRPFGLDESGRVVSSRTMTEDMQKLRDTLARLQADLDTADTRDPEVRARLAQALQRAAEKLEERSSGAALAAATPTATEDLTEMAQKFEADHPTLAATLRGVVDSLASMGI